MNLFSAVNQRLEHLTYAVDQNLQTIDTQKICQIISTINAVAAVGLAFIACAFAAHPIVWMPLTACVIAAVLVSVIFQIYERCVDPEATGIAPLKDLKLSECVERLLQQTYQTFFGPPRITRQGSVA